MSKAQLLELAYNAMATEYGLVVETPQPETLRQRLYAIIRAEALPLRLQIPAAEGELWLIKKPGSDGTKFSFMKEITL